MLCSLRYVQAWMSSFLIHIPLCLVNVQGLVCVSDVVKIYEDGLRGRGPDASMQILNGHGGVTSVNASNDTARGPGSLPLDGVCRAMLYPPASCDPRLLTGKA